METATYKHIELNVKGMSCTNCALGIEKYLEKEGLSGISVDFASDEVLFDIEEESRIPVIIKGIERLGFEVIGDDQQTPQRFTRIERLFLISLIFTIPLILHMFLPIAILHNEWFQLVMATPVYLLGMYHFGRSGWNSLRTGVPNMDVLIAVGATAAFFYSLYGTLAEMGPDFLFYETAASIITIVLLGNVMEHRAVQKTTSAVKDLDQLQDTPARRITMENGQEVLQEIRSGMIHKGDLLQVNTGDRIPVDGRVGHGFGEADESMITGESLPVMKGKHDKVIGGTVLVSGNLRMQATEVGNKTVLANIIEMVKKAQADKPNIQQLADRISAIFVPAVLGIAVLTFLVSYFLVGISLQAAIIHSVAVLVIACPCAMGLATPTAVVVGIGRATRQGILIKGGRTLEQFSTIKRVVFDKTGTLTTGRFSLKAIQCAPEIEEKVKQLVYSIESHSSHPIAKSLTEALKGHDTIQFQSVREIKGIGLVAVDNQENQYQLGSFRIAQGLTDDTSHSLYLLESGNLIATLDLEDELRPGAAETIQFLKQQGIEPVILSGDKKEACEKIANQLGITEVYAEQLPDQKLELLEKFAADMPTAMVGDGINDAPALARAHVGISLGNATEVAQQSAQILLLNNNLTLVKDLYEISKHTVITIKQNLFWAFFYNVIAIPFAAIGFLRPIIAAFTMALSDVIVIGNSLRLKSKKLR